MESISKKTAFLIGFEILSYMIKNWKIRGEYNL